MPVNTAKVDGRRNREYKSFDELLADAERLSTGDVKSLGNWTPGQFLQHLANAFNGSIDGFPAVFPWFIRALARPFTKRPLEGAMPVGLKMPAKLAKAVMPEPTPTEVGLANLRTAVLRLRQDSHRAPHPALGEIATEKWDAIHLQHASLHMSFFEN